MFLLQVRRHCFAYPNASAYTPNNREKLISWFSSPAGLVERSRALENERDWLWVESNSPSSKLTMLDANARLAIIPTRVYCKLYNELTNITGIISVNLPSKLRKALLLCSSGFILNCPWKSDYVYVSRLHTKLSISVKFTLSVEHGHLINIPC